jgi:hypothetical protein
MGSSQASGKDFDHIGRNQGVLSGMMQKACAALQLSRAMVFRLLARYRKAAGLAPCFCTHADESVEVEDSEKSRSRSLLRRSARSVGKSGRLRPYTERSPKLVENADFRFPPMGPCCDGLKPTPGGLPEPLGWLAVYWHKFYTLTVNTE